MKFSLLASAALLGAASAGEAYVYNAYNTYDHKAGSIHTHEVCTTQYCSEHAVHPVPTYVATVNKKEVEKVTVIAWYTKTVIDHYKTATKYKTETEWCEYTVPAKTVTDTSVHKITETKTLTEVCKTVTATVTETKTVKAAAGGYGNGYGYNKEKRGGSEYGYEAPPPPPAHYPTAVKCVKTLEAIYTQTVKVPKAKVTVTECEHTKTVIKHVKHTKTVYPAHATVTVWKAVTSTYWATVKKSITKTDTVTKYHTVTAGSYAA